MLKSAWRGKGSSQPNGEGSYYSEWEALMQHLERMLENKEAQDEALT